MKIAGVYRQLKNTITFAVGILELYFSQFESLPIY